MFGSNLRKYLIKPFITKMVKPLDLMGAHECATTQIEGKISSINWPNLDNLLTASSTVLVVEVVADRLYTVSNTTQWAK